MLIVHLVIIVLLYNQFGLNTLNEGEKYLKEAKFLLQGNFQKALQFQGLYASYIFFLALCLKLHIPVVCIFFIIYLLNWLGYVYYTKLVEQWLGAYTAKLVLVCLVCSPLLQFWQLTLFSEPFFIAMSLLFIYCLLYEKIAYRFLKASLLGLIVLFARPSGVFVVSSCAIIYMLQYFVLNRKLIFSGSILTYVLLFIVIIFMLPMHYNGFSAYIARGAIYYGFPTLSKPLLPVRNYTLYEVYTFLFHNYGLNEIVYLFIKKVDSFFVLTRPYYSKFHNIMNGLNYVFYVLGGYVLLYFIRQLKKMPLLIVFCFLIIVFNALMVGLIFNEWHERHTVHVLPYFITVGCYGFYLLKNRLTRRAV